MLSFGIEVLNQGLAYGVLAIAVTLTYKILDFPDLSVDGSFPLGSVIAAVVLLKWGSIPLALLLAFIGGLGAGLLTGFLHVKLKISNLLSGILVMTGLYSINLMIADNRSNLPIFNVKTMFTVGAWVEKLPQELQPWVTKFYSTLILLIVIVLLKLVMDWFLETKLGFLLRITGDNPQLVIALGEDIGKTKILGLMLSNGIAAFSGAIAMQMFRFYDISLGSGIVVVGLASVVLGTSVLGFMKSWKITTLVVLGSILYRLSISVALALKLPPSNLKLITAIIFILALVLNNKELRPKFLKGWDKHA